MSGFEMSRFETPKKDGSRSFRERAGAWKGIVEAATEEILDDIMERVVSPGSRLYRHSLKSSFREDIGLAAKEAVDELLQLDRGNFGDPIDRRTEKWDQEIAESMEDPNKEIEGRGKVVAEWLSTLAGSRENLVGKIVAIMVEQEEERRGKERGMQ